MSARLFGTDGIRGRAGEEPLIAETLQRLGFVLGQRLDGSGPALLSHDGRESGEPFVAALAEGLNAAGTDTDVLGLATTPSTAFLVSQGEWQAGIVVSASHNPASDNGIKVLGGDGAKLDDATEMALEAELASLEEISPVKKLGVARRSSNLVGDYVAWLREEAFPNLDLQGRRIAVDCAQGAASKIASRVMRTFGAEFLPLSDQPDGRNINLDCGSTHPEYLAKFAREQDCHAAVALDGDADRGLLADGTGRLLDGDVILAGLTPLLQEKGLLAGKTVVATVMSNLALERAVEAVGCALFRTPVGDRHVATAMHAQGWNLGGEKSGHMLFGEEHGFRGDGLYTLLKVLDALGGQSLVNFAPDYQDFPQELVNLPVSSKPPLESLVGLTQAMQEVESLLGKEGRIVVRYSGTETKLRLMVEATRQDLVDQAQALLQTAVAKDGILV